MQVLAEDLVFEGRFAGRIEIGRMQARRRSSGEGCTSNSFFGDEIEARITFRRPETQPSFRLLAHPAGRDVGDAAILEEQAEH